MKNYANSPKFLMVLGVVSFLMGIIFIVTQFSNKPIEREEAFFYSGTFAKYEISENYCELYLEDGTSYSVYPHTQTSDFTNTMVALAKGTPLHIAVNPNNDYVIEIKTDSQELMNFETSQRDIVSYGFGYISIGIAVLVASIFLIVVAVLSSINRRKEDERNSKREKRSIRTGNSGALRRADTSVKSRILLDAKIKEYEICYRRVKSVNELVINGMVYDEKKAILEFEHRLCATIDGHSIEAGLDSTTHSYIAFDGTIIKYKQRII